MCPQQQYQICIDARYKQADSVNDRPRSGNSHTFVEKHPNIIFWNDKARPHRARVVYHVLEEDNIERMDP